MSATIWRCPIGNERDEQYSDLRCREANPICSIMVFSGQLSIMKRTERSIVERGRNWKMSTSCVSEQVSRPRPMAQKHVLLQSRPNVDLQAWCVLGTIQVRASLPGTENNMATKQPFPDHTTESLANRKSQNSFSSDHRAQLFIRVLPLGDLQATTPFVEVR